MNLEPGEDLAVFMDAIDHIATRHRASWTAGDHRFEHAFALQAELRDGGFFACATEASLGALAATTMVHALAKLPVCAELAASALIGPLVCPEHSTPMAVVWGDAGRPTRHLPHAQSVLHVGADVVRIARLQTGDVDAVDSLYAYPMGRLHQPARMAWQLVGNHTRTTILRLWRVGVAAELLGCLQAGLDAVVAHVTDRRQFGRPLGSFQGVQHRLATAASSIEGARWLTLKAAYTATDVDAITAAATAQSIATRIVYDLHQFMGAMGLTLEHPLHRWTYRAKLLRADLGGAEQQFANLADLAWPPR